uniref:Uncharacterized protein n=1 Tax=Eutreptiella gymnastica TaxID=73025 RepID=A0A7S4D2R8_9EUGL
MRSDVRSTRRTGEWVCGFHARQAAVVVAGRGICGSRASLLLQAVVDLGFLDWTLAAQHLLRAKRTSVHAVQGVGWDTPSIGPLPPHGWLWVAVLRVLLPAT